MYARFLDFNKEHQLFQVDDKILLTVSGGLDSVILFDLMLKAQFNFVVAHCNFGLRGEESDLDAIFVKELAEKNNIPVFIQKFQTKEYAESQGISTQMAAREMRYTWFEVLRLKENLDYIATAHHQNDNLETFLLNLIRGTGIAGLHGIPPKKNRIIRPLLFANREQIQEYAQENQIQWREDNSNQSNKYKRNLLRNQVIPLLKTLNPNLEITFQETIEKLNAVELLFSQQIQMLKNQVFTIANNQVCIEFAYFKNTFAAEIQLFELIKIYHFNYTQAKQILASIENGSGKIFLSATHQLFIDRTHLMISEKKENKNDSIWEIALEQDFFENDVFSLHFEIIHKNPNFQFSTENNCADLDFDKLKFPLQIRTWQQGDTFYPLGMKGKKKISDFLIDLKVPLLEKENVFVLLSDEDIVWVMGLRIDNRFKITPKTQQILRCKIS